MRLIFLGPRAAPRDFPLVEFLDEDACYAKLLDLLHPGGLACPRCGAGDRRGGHRRPRTPVLDSQGGHCGRVFNAGTGTFLHRRQRRPAPVLLILRGIAQGPSTAPLACARGCDRRKLLARGHRLPEHARLGRDRNPRGDTHVAADEMDQNAGAKRDRA